MEFNYTNWTNKNIDNLINYLYQNQDLTYKKFNDRIVNTKTKTIGVRVPILRQIAKEIYKGNYVDFLNQPQVELYEYNMIYGLVLSKIKDNNIAYPLFKNFINTIDNWAVCDIFCSEYKVVKNNKNFYLNKINKYISSDQEFIVRVGLILLMKFYIDSNLDDIFNLISKIRLNKYYVNMGIAWLLSMAYIKYPTETITYILNSKLSTQIKRMSYQKIVESKQVTLEQKIHIKSLRNELKNS